MTNTEEKPTIYNLLKLYMLFVIYISLLCFVSYLFSFFKKMKIID